MPAISPSIAQEQAGHPAGSHIEPQTLFSTLQQESDLPKTTQPSKEQRPLTPAPCMWRQYFTRCCPLTEATYISPVPISVTFALFLQ